VNLDLPVYRLSSPYRITYLVDTDGLIVRAVKVIVTSASDGKVIAQCDCPSITAAGEAAGQYAKMYNIKTIVTPLV
jgi:hypothetical protein